MRKMIEAMVAQMESLERTASSWRNCNGKLEGMGPDAQRKFMALKIAINAMGYSLGYGYDGITFYFDRQRAEELQIPAACWTEEAVEEMEREKAEEETKGK